MTKGWNGLTKPQHRIYAAVQAGPRTYTGVATPAIETLEARDLVAYVDWDADLDKTKGRLRWCITVWPYTIQGPACQAGCWHDSCRAIRARTGEVD